MTPCRSYHWTTTTSSTMAVRPSESFSENGRLGHAPKPRQREMRASEQRDTVMNETTFHEGTTHEPATGRTPTILETKHEPITQEGSNHETTGLDIRPREDESRNPRLAEEEYEDPQSNRESHSLKWSRANLHVREFRGFKTALCPFRPCACNWNVMLL